MAWPPFWQNLDGRFLWWLAAIFSAAPGKATVQGSDAGASIYALFISGRGRRSMDVLLPPNPPTPGTGKVFATMFISDALGGGDDGNSCGVMPHSHPSGEKSAGGNGEGRPARDDFRPVVINENYAFPRGTRWCVQIRQQALFCTHFCFGCLNAAGIELNLGAPPVTTEGKQQQLAASSR